jgi:hypothetical protein
VFLCGEAVAVEALAVGAVAWRWFRSGVEITGVGNWLLSTGDAGWGDSFA